jgi:hypothetical protein
VFAAIVADDLEALRRVVARRRFFRTAFDAALGRHHVSLIENFLLFLREKKNFLTLNTRNFDIRHLFFSSYCLILAVARSLSQTRPKATGDIRRGALKLYFSRLAAGEIQARLNSAT